MSDLLTIEEAFIDVFTASPKPPHFVVENLLPAGLVIIGAPPKSYKSTMVMSAVAVVAGFICRVLPKELRQVPQNGPVMVWSSEADAGELRFMLEQGMGVAGKPDGSILIARSPWEYRLDEDEGSAQMLSWLNTLRPRLAIIDPLRNFHGLEEKDSGDMVRILGPLRQWAVDNMSCLVVVHHTRKVEDDGRSLRPTDLRGSSALFGMCDGVLMMTPNARVPLRVIIEATFKRAEGWRKEIDLAVYTAAGAESGEVLPAVTMQVLQSVEHGYGASEDISRHIGIAEREVRKRLRWLVSRGYIERKNRRWVLAVEGDS